MTVPSTRSDPLTTRYAVDENARLRFMVSAEGRVSENRYESAGASSGLLTLIFKYTGQVFDVTGLDPTEPQNEAQLIDWVAGLADKGQVQLTEYRLTCAATSAGRPATPRLMRPGRSAPARGRCARLVCAIEQEVRQTHALREHRLGWYKHALRGPHGLGTVHQRGGAE